MDTTRADIVVEVKRGRPAKPPARSRSIYPTDALWNDMRRVAIDQNRSITAMWEEAARLFLAVMVNSKNIPNGRESSKAE